MTKEEILAMKAGADLDSKVFKTIFYDSYMRQAIQKPRPYSTDISAAWLVVEKLIKKGYFLELHYGLFQKGWECNISKQLPANNPVRNIKTAPEAICKAALLIEELDEIKRLEEGK